MHHLFRGLRPLLWLLRLLMVFLAVYLVLAVVEEEDLRNFVQEPAHLWQVLFLVTGYALLALFTDWLIRFQRPRLSQLNADRQALLMYLKRSYLIPLVPFLLLPSAYISLWSQPAAGLLVAKHILCISLTLLVLFSLVNQLFLTLYFLTVNARAHKLAMFARAKAVLQESVVTDTEALSPHDTDLARYMVFILHERKVTAYDGNRKAVVLKYRSLTEVKRQLADDPRFFMTGSWILRYDALDRQEKGGRSRGLKLYSNYIPAGFFELNKNYKRQFLDWFEQANGPRNTVQ
jgi:hypothetical protein